MLLISKLDGVTVHTHTQQNTWKKNPTPQVFMGVEKGEERRRILNSSYHLVNFGEEDVPSTAEGRKEKGGGRGSLGRISKHNFLSLP